MYTRELWAWIGVALSLLGSFNSELLSPPNILALCMLAVFSRLAIGNLAIFALATLLLAVSQSNLRSDDTLQAVYLPLYVMAAAIYLLCRLVAWAPGLGTRIDAPGSGSGGGAGYDGGGGCSGGGGDGGG